MDPVLTPAHSEDELTRVSDANSEQTIRRTSSANADQVAQTTTTTTATPTSRSKKTVSSSGVTPQAAKEYGQKKTLFHAYQIIWYIFGFVEISLAFRFVLKMLGANPAAGFTKFVYGVSWPFAGPFSGMFHASTTNGVETTSFFEWSTLVAAIVYIVITWGIVKIFKLGAPTDPRDVLTTVEGQ